MKSNEIARQLHSFCTILFSRLTREAELHGLSRAQARTLFILASHPGLPLGDVAAKSGVTPSTASVTCQYLETKGLLVRERNPEDARSCCLRLTSSGESMARQLSTWDLFLREAIGGMSDEAQAQLSENLSYLLGATVGVLSNQKEQEK